MSDLMTTTPMAMYVVAGTGPDGCGVPLKLDKDGNVILSETDINKIAERVVALFQGK